MKKQTLGWYHMQSMQATLTTEYWSQYLIPTYFHCVSLQKYIDERIYFLTGVKNSKRIIDIKAVRENFVTSMNVCNATDELFLASIIGFHSFTVCDTVSTFSGRGKAKPLKLKTESLRYTKAFSMFGKEITLPDSLVNTLEMLVCQMYNWKENYIDNVRYRMYC